MSKKIGFANTPAKRLLKMSGLGVRVANKVVKYKISNLAVKQPLDKAELHADIAEEIVQTLGQMKGAAMKVGQIAAQLGHLLPDGMRETLEQLQYFAEPIAYEDIQTEIKRSLGFTPEQLFAFFDKEPFAAASIGQVYRARSHQGDELVVKVQYPGVKRSCQSDLIQLKRLFVLSGLLNVDKQALDEVFDEIEVGLMKELDYCIEADNLFRFRAFHQNNPAIIVPKVYGDLSSDTVLTLAYEPGDKLQDLVSEGYPLDLRNQLAQTLIESALQEVLWHKEAHADPHPGNFAFRKTGELVIYDYGLTADMQELIIDAYLDIYEAAIDNRFQDIDDILIGLGIRNEQVAALSPEVYRDWHRAFLEPLLAGVSMDKVIPVLQQEIEAHMSQFLSLRGVFKPSAATLFINRIASGHLLNLSMMSITLDLRPIFSRYLYE